MQNNQPLLSIAIPTYNRAAYLRPLLRNLIGQIAGDLRVELIISDNASTDGTYGVIQESEKLCASLRVNRNETNIGPDGNILNCFLLAQGRYVWIFGDDDVVLPEGIQRVLHLLEGNEYDLVFLTPFGYISDPLKEFRQPRIRRPTEEVTDVCRYVRLVNRHSDMVFISSMIVNKERIDPHRIDEFSRWVGTNLIQLGWVMTSLNQFRRGLFVESGIVAGKLGNSSGGFHAAQVFGVNYARAIDKWIPYNRRLRSLLINDQLFLWFSSNWLVFARGDSESISTEDPEKILTPIFGTNIRYWLAVYPLLRLPSPVASLWAQFLRIPRFISRLCFKI